MIVIGYPISINKPQQKDEGPIESIGFPEWQGMLANLERQLNEAAGGSLLGDFYWIGLSGEIVR